jgi:endogenous inhibitor of DNA gyrase (YacG/DUF329 family)
MTNCVVCSGALERRAKGRPARYCSARCKRTVEFRVRGWRAELADIEDALRMFESDDDVFAAARLGELRAERAALVAKLLQANARPYPRRRYG